MVIPEYYIDCVDDREKAKQEAGGPVQDPGDQPPLLLVCVLLGHLLHLV